MAPHGYGGLPDRAFVGFERELDDGAWKEIATPETPENLEAKPG